MRQEFVEEIENTAKDTVNGIHTALPGKIVSVDTEKGTASIQPVGKFVLSDGRKLDYPMLTEVPLVFPLCQQGQIGIAYPVKKDDCCLVILSEIELDEWRNEAEAEGTLRFDLTNAIAIPGLYNKKNEMLAKAMEEDAIVLETPAVEVMISKKEAKVTVGQVKMSVSESGIAAWGDFNIKGNILYTGTVKRIDEDEMDQIIGEA